MALWYGDADRCYSTDYDYNYGPTPPDLTYAHESGEPIEYYYKSYAYYTTPSEELNYSVYTYSEPKVLQYDPSAYNYYQSETTNYFQPKYLQYESSPSVETTKLSICSYSSVEFNEPEWEEYDPTPYGGGYDPVATYGKPLPPSQATCYPPTLPQPRNTSLENFSFASIPSPYGKHDDAPPPNAISHLPAAKPTADGDKVSNESIEVTTTNDPPPPPPYVRETGWFQIESPQLSYGSGLEAIDLCESIFGYWPCLAKQQARNKCQACDQEIIRPDHWDQRAADYLFGTPLVYDYQNVQHQH